MKSFFINILKHGIEPVEKGQKQYNAVMYALNHIRQYEKMFTRRMECNSRERFHTILDVNVLCVVSYVELFTGIYRR